MGEPADEDVARLLAHSDELIERSRKASRRGDAASSELRELVKQSGEARAAAKWLNGRMGRGKETEPETEP